MGHGMVRDLNKLVQEVKKAPKKGIQFVVLSRGLGPLGDFVIVGCFDASFANLAQRRTQGGGLVYLAAAADFDYLKGVKRGSPMQRVFQRDTVVKLRRIRANLVTAFSKKLRRVAGSTLAAELLTLVTLVDCVVALRLFIERLMNRSVPVIIFGDCGSLITAVHSKYAPCTVSSKRLQIDLYILKEALEEGLVDFVEHLPARCNPADDLTKTQGTELLEHSSLGTFLIPAAVPELQNK